MVSSLPDNQHMLLWSGWSDIYNDARREASGARLVNIENGQVLRTFAPFLDGEVSGDGHRLVGRASDGLVRIWNIDNGEKLCEFKGEYRAVSFDGSKLCDASQIRNATTGRVTRTLPIGMEGVAFSPDGSHVFVANATSVELWNIDQERAAWRASRRFKGCAVVHYASDVTVTGNPESQLGGGAAVHYARFLPNGRFAYTVSRDSLVIWKLPETQQQ